jgi:predicted DNA-binding transcriptional regulator AlpA
MPATDVLDDPAMFEVVRVTRLSPTTIWRKEKRGEFPPRHHDGRCASWFRSQIAAHMEARRQNPSGIGPAPVKANEARRAATRRKADRKEARPPHRRKHERDFVGRRS